MRDSVGEVRTSSKAKFSDQFLHMEEELFDDQLELISNSSVRTQNAV